MGVQRPLHGGGSQRIMALRTVLLATLAAALVVTDAAVPHDLDLNLLQEVTTDRDSNQAISPFLLSNVLSQLWLGASGNTQDEIGAVLGINGVDHLYGYSSASESLSRNSSVTTALFNRLYMHERARVKPLFLHGIGSIYGGDVDTFSTVPEVVQAINTDVAKVTNDRIKDLVSEDSLDSNTELVLVGALYFKGKWRKKFDKAYPGDFYTERGVTKVPLMSLDTSLLYYKSEDFDAVSLPFKDENYSLMIIRPLERSQTSVSKLYGSIKSLNVTEIYNGMSSQYVVARMPKFKIEANYDLKPSLTSLGIRQMFTGQAEFCSISDTPLKVDKVIHKVFMEVNELGTEAAAAVAVSIVPLSAVVSTSTVYFTVDRPFLAVLYHSSEQLNLFSAWVGDPIA